MDGSPTALFEAYEHDFKNLIQTIRQKLDDNSPDEPSGIIFIHNLFISHGALEQRKATLRRAEMELEEADEMVYE
jgi:vesicle transport through interaction with t-SNAREs 1